MILYVTAATVYTPSHAHDYFIWIIGKNTCGEPAKIWISRLYFFMIYHQIVEIKRTLLRRFFFKQRIETILMDCGFGSYFNSLIWWIFLNWRKLKGNGMSLVNANNKWCKLQYQIYPSKGSISILLESIILRRSW